MKRLAAFFERVRLRQILTVFLAGIALFVTTACNTGDMQGAREENPPVQAGGMNNPYKGGGDGYTENKSTDPSANTPNSGRDAANLQLISNRLVAVNDTSELIYPATEAPALSTEKVSPKSIEQPAPGGQIQREPNIGERIEDRLEAVKEAFQGAGSFLTDKEDEDEDVDVDDDVDDEELEVKTKAAK